jgi:predicted RNase H-like HicB family nuclease
VITRPPPRPSRRTGRRAGPGDGIRSYNETVTRNFSYSVFYETDPEGGFVARVPALPGCHTQGDTLEEAERNVREAIQVYLESLAAHGEPIPEESKSYQGRVSVPVSIPA